MIFVKDTIALHVAESNGQVYDLICSTRLWYWTLLAHPPSPIFLNHLKYLTCGYLTHG